jgi:RNA polymerase sigma-70 factor (ECF subfamily)
VQAQRGHQGEVGAALLRGLRAGSSQAWARLYDQLAPGIHRFAVCCLSGDTESAEDVVVETLALAARDIARFDPQKSPLSAWIYGIARHRVQAEQRWCRRRKSVPAWAQVSFEDLSELADSRDLGARTAARLDAQRRVGELPDLLSDAEMEVLDLSAVEELPGVEIGRVVGRSEQATRSLLKRAKQKVRRTAIEGTLFVNCIHTQVFSGLEDWFIGDELGLCPDLAPVSDEAADARYATDDLGHLPVSAHIWRAKRDGSGAVDLTQRVGLGGVNMAPRWSPDGTLVAFIHTDGRRPGWGDSGEAWIMRADGSEAKIVTPEGRGSVSSFSWSADGSWLLCHGASASVSNPPLSVDLWGKHVRVAVGVGNTEWSRDGANAAHTQTKRGRLEGEPGYWRRLVVTEGDGSHPQVLVEQFIADAHLDACHRLDPEQPVGAGPGYDWRSDLLTWAGPHGPRWSPRGDKVAFLAALPFDPEQMTAKRQVDAWVYDLATRRVTKITNAPHKQRSVSWR